MNKLLAANFMRLKKSRIFWLCMLFMAGLAVVMVISNYRALTEGSEITLESMAFAFTPFAGIVISCFVSLFIGTEYSDGTMRNKIIIGHTRSAIYLADFITTAVAGVLMCVSYLVVYIGFGVPVTGWFTCEMKSLVLVLFCALVLSVTLSALFTWIAMVNQSKAVAAVVSVLLAFVLLFTASYILNRLSEPEYQGGYYMDESGKLRQQEETKNPRYLKGTKRDVYEFCNDFLPGGQQLQLAEGAVQHPWILMGYSGMILIVTTAAGAATFRRKDLK